MNQNILIKALAGSGSLRKVIALALVASAILANTAIADSSATGDLKEDIPWPGAGASLGLGLVLKRLDIDLALYGDPARSYVEQSLNLGATGTLTYKF